MRYITLKDGVLRFKRRQEILEISAVGEGLRIRSSENVNFSDRDWALTGAEAKQALIELREEDAVVSNGKIRAVITEYGKIRFYNQKDELLLQEYYRSWDYGTENWVDLNQTVMLRIPAREYSNVGGDNYKVTLRFETDSKERIYGMGEYQHPYLNLKGCRLEMAPKNTQISVPFGISSRGYGLLWNNPGTGYVNFSNNITEYCVDSCKQIDYWITAGDTPAEIEENYADVVGKAPLMPDFAMGFWQCKLRYISQEEILSVAREYYRRRIPVKVIVIDFFHWLYQGDWKFDSRYWPDPEAMVKELHDMGMKLMVSVWPTVEDSSENSMPLREGDMVIRSNRGQNYLLGPARLIDMTNPDAREYLWKTCRKNYFDLGVDLFWLDEAEPGYMKGDFDMYRLHDGSAQECANIFSLNYAKAFYDGMKAEGVDNPINLIRCAWAGSQKYGVVVWSGDIPSTFEFLNYQIKAGLNMGMAGIPWWTSDIGGFHGGNIGDEVFRELLIRWFQFGTFCPVMRLHGSRDPQGQPFGTQGGELCASGANNEVWSYGKECERIMLHYIGVRERMQPYIADTMKEAHEKGTPVMKPLFYDFPEDERAWEVEDSYLFGHDLLVSPVTEKGSVTRKVYLPSGAEWTEVFTKKTYEGGQTVTVSAPIDIIPLFVKNGASVMKMIDAEN